MLAKKVKTSVEKTGNFIAARKMKVVFTLFMVLMFTGNAMAANMTTSEAQTESAGWITLLRDIIGVFMEPPLVWFVEIAILMIFAYAAKRLIMGGKKK